MHMAEGHQAASSGLLGFSGRASTHAVQERAEQAAEAGALGRHLPSVISVARLARHTRACPTHECVCHCRGRPGRRAGLRANNRQRVLRRQSPGRTPPRRAVSCLHGAHQPSRTRGRPASVRAGHAGDSLRHRACTCSTPHSRPYARHPHREPQAWDHDTRRAH